MDYCLEPWFQKRTEDRKSLRLGDMKLGKAAAQYGHFIAASLRDASWGDFAIFS
jgi:hypothetical protein